MYLKEIENREPPAEAGRYGRVIAHCRTQGTEPPGIYYLFAQRPLAAKHLSNFMEDVMRGPSELSPGFRELIATFVSAQNRCRF